MDDGGHHEDGRSRAEQYEEAQNQHHQPTFEQIMVIMAERDAAIQEMNVALLEIKTAMTERDTAVMQRDSAINERENAIMERDNALATLNYRDTPIYGNNNMSQLQTQCSPGCQISCGAKHMHHFHDEDQEIDEELYDSIDLQITEDIPLSPVASVSTKSRVNKWYTKSAKKLKRKKDGLNKLMFGKSHEWKHANDIGSGSDYTGKQNVVTKTDWKGQDSGLNLVVYDDTTMPTPVCSCTGVFRQCYKWGNSGWQSSCCTNSISQYPLPSVPDKRHARVGGRKMSGGAYSKLLTRLSQESHDLSNPVDLKECWAKHGTNKYITIK